MEFPWDLYITAAVCGCLFSFLSLPLWLKFSRRTHLLDHPGHRKIHQKATPLAGGPTLITGFILGGALIYYLQQYESGHHATDVVRYGIGAKGNQLLALVFGSILMFGVGLWDDYRGLPASAKFAGQFMAALLVALSGIRISLFVANPIFGYAVTLLWILTLVNALNFMDNMNGLCSGLGAITCWAFAWLAAKHGQYLAAGLGFLLFGVLFGFLPWNYPKARSFLGDSGSHLVGFWLAALALMPDYYQGAAGSVSWKPFILPALFVLAPLLDLVSVVWIRWRAGNPVYIGDNNHFSHRLCKTGKSRSEAVLWIWLLGALGVGAGFLLESF